MAAPHTNHWWRAHHGISNDAKLQFLALRTGAKRCEVGWVWVILVDFASQNQPLRGSIAGLDPGEVAIMADLPEDKVQTIMNAMKDRGMIQSDGSLSSWAKRQPQRERGEGGDLTAAARQRRRREKLRNAVTDVTECHDSVTRDNRDVTEGGLEVVENKVSKNGHVTGVTVRHGDVTVASRDVTVRHGDVTQEGLQLVEELGPNNLPVTPCHAQRRGEERREEESIKPSSSKSNGKEAVKRPLKSWYDSIFDSWYESDYWRKTSRKDARRAYEKALNQLVDKEKKGYKEAQIFLSSMAKNDRSRFEYTEEWAWRKNMHPSTWLNGAKWTDTDPLPSGMTSNDRRRDDTLLGLEAIDRIKGRA